MSDRERILHAISVALNQAKFRCSCSDFTPVDNRVGTRILGVFVYPWDYLVSEPCKFSLDIGYRFVPTSGGRRTYFPAESMTLFSIENMDDVSACIVIDLIETLLKEYRNKY